MYKQIVITTRDGFKFEFRGELAKEIEESIWVDESNLIHFGKDRLIIPVDTLNYYWANETNQEG